MSTGLVHDDADTGSPSIGDTVPQSFGDRLTSLGDRLTSYGDRLHVVESGLKATNSRMAHHEETTNLKKDTLIAQLDAKFTQIDGRFDAMEAKFDRKFGQMEMLFKTTAADILKQQKENENRMLSRLLLAVSPYSCILCILHPNGM
jgi:hypothetical protein